MSIRQAWVGLREMSLARGLSSLARCKPRRMAMPVRIFPHPASFTYAVNVPHTRSSASKGGRGAELWTPGAKLAALGVAAFAGIAAYVQCWKNKDGLPLEVRLHVVNARRAITDSRFQTAITEYEDAARLMAQVCPNDRTIVFFHDAIGNLFLRLGQYDKAAEFFRSTVRGLIAHGVAQDSLEVVELSVKIARCFAKIGDVENAHHVWSRPHSLSACLRFEVLLCRCVLSYFILSLSLTFLLLWCPLGVG
eukprot:m.640658 g.640658  ORF g.640658 m.640658 type:complete len:250 (-) comp58343_c0_seq24:241-990(-)